VEKEARGGRRDVEVDSATVEEAGQRGSGGRVARWRWGREARDGCGRGRCDGGGGGRGRRARWRWRRKSEVEEEEEGCGA